MRPKISLNLDPVISGGRLRVLTLTNLHYKKNWVLISRVGMWVSKPLSVPLCVIRMTGIKIQIVGGYKEVGGTDQSCSFVPEICICWSEVAILIHKKTAHRIHPLLSSALLWKLVNQVPRRFTFFTFPKSNAEECDVMLWAELFGRPLKK